MKRLMIAIGILLGLLVVAVLALPYLLDLNRYRDQYLPVVEDALQRRVAVGDIQLMWWPHIGARVEGVEIADDPSVSPNAFVSVADVDVAVKWGPLLQRRVEVASVTLHKPNVTIIKTPEGALNMSTLGGAAQDVPDGAPPPKEDSPPPLLALFAVEQLTLSEGTVIYEDRTQAPPQVHRLEQVHLNTSSVKLGELAQLKLDATLTPQQLPVGLEATIGPLQESANLERIDATVRSGRAEIHLKGSLAQGRLDANVTSARIESDDVPIALGLEGPLAIQNLSARVQVPVLARPSTEPSRVSDQPTVDPFAFDVVMRSSTLAISGSLVGSQVRLRGSSPALRTEDLPVALPLKEPVTVNDLSIDSVTTLKESGPAVDVSSLRGQLFGGQFATTASFVSGATPTFTAKGGFEGFNVDEVQRAVQPSTVTLQGRGQATWDIQGALEPSGPPRVTGHAGVTIADGQLVGVDLLQQIEEALKLHGLLSETPGVTRFTLFDGKVDLEGASIPVRRLALESEEFAVTGDGVVNLDQTLNLKGNFQLAERLSAKVVNKVPVAKVAVRQGRLSVPFVVSGTATEPSVTLDLGSIQQRLQQKVGDAVNKLLQGDKSGVKDVLKEGKGFLKQLFGR